MLCQLSDEKYLGCGLLKQRRFPAIGISNRRRMLQLLQPSPIEWQTSLLTSISGSARSYNGTTMTTAFTTTATNTHPILVSKIRLSENEQSEWPPAKRQTDTPSHAEAKRPRWIMNGHWHARQRHSSENLSSPPPPPLPPPLPPLLPLIKPNSYHPATISTITITTDKTTQQSLPNHRHHLNAAIINTNAATAVNASTITTTTTTTTTTLLLLPLLQPPPLLPQPLPLPCLLPPP